MLRKYLLLSVLTLLLTSSVQAQVVPAIQKSEHMRLTTPGKMPGVIASSGQEIPSWDAYLKTPDPVYGGIPGTSTVKPQRVLEISKPKMVSSGKTVAAPGIKYPVLAQSSGAVPAPGQPTPALVPSHPTPVIAPGMNPGPVHCGPKASCGHQCNWKRLWEWMTFCPSRNGYLCGGCHTCAPSCQPPLYMYFLPCHSGCRPQCTPPCAPVGAALPH